MRRSLTTVCFGIILMACAVSDATEIPLSYEQAVAHVRQLSSQGRYTEAETVLRKLEQNYPDNPEVAAFLGRLKAWQKQYEASFVYLRLSLAQRRDPELASLLAQVETFLQLERIASWELAGETSRAVDALKQLCSQEREPYESCRRLGLLQLKMGEAEAAYQTLSQLRSRYSDDSDIALMTIRALGASSGYTNALARLDELPTNWQQRPDAVELRRKLQLTVEQGKRKQQQQELERLLKQGDVSGARLFFEDLPRQEQAALEHSAPALPYQLRQQNIRLSSTLAGDSRGMPLEKQFDLAVTYRMPWVTTVLQGGWASRYGEHDTRIGGELYVSLREDRRRILQLAGSFSPGASFLPRSALNAEVSQSVGNWELALGAMRLAFADETVHLAVPRLSWYLPNGWSLAEQLHVVVENGTLSSQTTVMWQPTYRFASRLGITIGEAGERLGDARDLARFFTVGARVESEYRFTPVVGMGVELFYEYRDRLYEKNGGGLFARYWW